MAITLATAARDAACNAIVDLIDTGGAGTLVLETAADAEVATLTFSATAFGASSTGTATAPSITNDASATGSGSNVTKFTIVNGRAADVLTGSVSTTGPDINLNKVLIDAGDVVSISALTVTMPAT